MILGLRYYKTKASSRAPLLRFMLEGLRAAQCRILFASSPDRAPFVITFETRDGERMGVVAYAFLATRTPTRNRPEDERSFQVKYGSKEDYADDNSHVLWQDPLGLFTTLLIGIDPDEGFFVAADPEAHNPTKFFIRIEFKDEHADAIRREGWRAWERSRRAGPMAEPVEVLIGGARDMLLDLIRLERAAFGLPPGERQLLAEKRDLIRAVHLDAAASDATAVEEQPHPLLRELALGADEVLELIANARRLKMAVRGWVAEEHLRAALSGLEGVTHCERLDEEGGPDLLVRYRDGPKLTIECKNVLRAVSKQNIPRIDFQRTRAAKSDPCSRYYSPGDFDIVAGCLHAVTERWEFRYTTPAMLEPHRKCEGRLASNLLVDEKWSSDPRRAFEAAAARLQ